MKVTVYLLPFFLLMIAACTAPAPDLGYLPGDVMDIEPLIIGETIPDITLENHQGEPINLLDESSENTLFVFYRGGWCPFCSAELAELASIEDQLYDLGINIVAVSPDRPQFLRQTMNDTDLSYTLLSGMQIGSLKSIWDFISPG